MCKDFYVFVLALLCCVFEDGGVPAMGAGFGAASGGGLGVGELQAPTITDWAAETQQWAAQQKTDTAGPGAQWGGGGSDWN